MKERVRQLELEDRYVRLPDTVKGYLSLTEAIAEVIPAQGDALRIKQQEYLAEITRQPDLQAHLANFLTFRNETRTHSQG